MIFSYKKFFSIIFFLTITFFNVPVFASITQDPFNFDFSKKGTTRSGSDYFFDIKSEGNDGMTDGTYDVSVYVGVRSKKIDLAFEQEIIDTLEVISTGIDGKKISFDVVSSVNDSFSNGDGFQVTLFKGSGNYHDPGTYKITLSIKNVVVDDLSLCLPTFVSSIGKSKGSQVCNNSTTTTNTPTQSTPDVTPNTPTPTNTSLDPVVNTTTTSPSTQTTNNTTNNPSKNTVTLEPSSTPTSTCPPDKPDCYQLFSGFSNILGKSFENIDSSQGLGGFMNGIISTVIKLAGVGAVIMIMVYGVQLWNTNDNGEKRKSLKSKMIGTISGLLLMLTTFIILRTINPDLLNLTPRIDDVAIKSGATLSTEDFQKITGEPLKTAGEYDQLIKDTAQKFNSDYCALRVIVQNESRGDPRIVGQDENVPSSSVPSRLAFINSQQKYSGATFIKDNGLISTATFCNDAAGCLGKVPKPNDPDLGLDWRFSKGIGLTQITFYPDDYSLFTKDGYTPKINNKHVVPSRSFSFNGQTMTVSASDVFKPEKNLEVSAKLWNEGVKKCNTPQGAFYTYMCGSCSCAGQYPKTEVAERVSQYNECKKTN